MRHPDAAVVKSGNAVFQLIHVFRSCDGFAAGRSLAALVSGYSGYGGYGVCLALLALKNSLRIAPHSSANTPPSYSTR